MKTYKVFARQINYLYAYVEAESFEDAQEQANNLDGSTFIDHGVGDWDIYSVEESDDKQ